MQISLKFVMKSSINNKTELAQVMAWRRTGDKPLPEPMGTKLHDAIEYGSIRLDCFTFLLARHLADVSCFIGPSMPSGICMEIHTEIVQKGKKKQSRDEGIPRQPHAYS